MNFNFYFDIFYSFFKDLKIFINLFLKEYPIIVPMLVGAFISFFIAVLSTFTYILLVLSIISVTFLICLFLYFLFVKYVPIIKEKFIFSMIFIENSEDYNFETPSLMADSIFDTKLFFTIKLNESFKNNIKKSNGKNYYTLVVKKNKSMTVNLDSEFVCEEDNQFIGRNSYYYYIVQEYQNQDELSFSINFSFSTVHNLSNCEIYLEYGDIHKIIDDSIYDNVMLDEGVLKNLFFDEGFFVTDMSSFIKSN